jgi:streptomycin 6-kinase
MPHQSHLSANISAIYGSAGELWLAQLPDAISQLSQKWEFQPLSAMSNLTYNYCAVVLMEGSQEKRVLKISPDSKRYLAELRALKALGSKVPRVYLSDPGTRAFLMEKLDPGISLKSLVLSGNDDQATEALAKCILGLQEEPPIQIADFPHLRDFLPRFQILKGFLPQSLLSLGVDLFASLCQDNSNDRLLHFDLHQDNVIQDGLSWRAIDPQGYVGHPIAEVGAMIRNPWDAFPGHIPMGVVIDRRIQILHEVLGFDLKSLNAWAFCITLLSEVWSVEDMGPQHRLDLDLLELLAKRAV